MKEGRVAPLNVGQHQKHVTATFNKDFIDKIVPGNKAQIGGFTPSLGSRNAKQASHNAKKLVGHALTGGEKNSLGLNGGSLGPINMQGSLMGKNFPAIRTSQNINEDTGYGQNK